MIAFSYTFRLLLLSFFFFVSCANNTSQTIKKDSISTRSHTLDSLVSALRAKTDSLPYSVLLAELSKEKLVLKKAYIAGQISIDSISSYFEKTLIRRILPYWYGTPWSFEGHTNTPQKGEIACGYFVSTTLKHIGINVNRYYMAQQRPIHEAKTIQLSDSILTLTKTDYDADWKPIFDKYLDDGLYLIGFDQSHVGYFWKRKSEFFLLHSDYNAPQEAKVEHIDRSLVIDFFQVYHFGEISNNKELMKRWLMGTEVIVVKQ